MAGLFSKLFGRGAGVSTVVDRDPQLGRVIDAVLEGCEYALAAGDGAADLAVQLAKRHAHREILACEPKSELCYQAENRAGNSKNIYLHNMTPKRFLRMVQADKPYLLDKDVLVVLSATGGGGERRFFDEVASVASAFQGAWLLVLGARVPDRDDFAFESHRGRECSVKNLVQHLGGTSHTLYFPTYAVPSSKRRQVPGWCLAALGRNAGVDLPDEAATLAAKPE